MTAGGNSMKERINRLAKGIIDAELPQMSWSPEVIEETVRMNTVFRRELLITSSNRLNVKGFVYSSNFRVRIPGNNNTFGGLRNHMVYEVDTSFLAAGDTIEGSFYLVTNCGEKEIPYHFRVDVSGAGELLGNLKTPEDFLHTAERDMDTALRLLEYPDFTEAPFMQDLHVRTVYDGLKGHGNRQNRMEEFLVALGVKDPISLTVEKKERYYENPAGRVEDTIELQLEGWGYQYLEFSADGDFLHLPKKSATQADFTEGVLALPFTILNERLHSGRNFGTILIQTARETVRLPIEVRIRESERNERRSLFREKLSKYLELRLEYESGMYESGLILNQMQKELDQMKMTETHLFLALLQAELYLLTKRREKAVLLLDEVRERVLVARLEDKAAYCFFQYLQTELSEDPEQKDSLLRLLERQVSGSFSEGFERDFYYLMFIKLNEARKESPEALLLSMEGRFLAGCHSPFLYMECLKLFEEDPDLLKQLSAFGVHALHFGAKKGMVSREMAILAAGILNTSRGYRPLYVRILTCFYETYPEPEILSALCSMLMKGNLRGSRYFRWYEAALNSGINLTRLYEFFLASLPEDYGRLLPKEVLLYFSYSTELDLESKTALYHNILLYADASSDSYQLYERAMEQFAVEQLFAGRMDSRLAVIYQRMIYLDLIDGQLAKVLPGILRSNQISCTDAAMSRVVVRQEELQEENGYPLKDGAAYVPIYSERDVLFFEDAYGNRYCNIPYEKHALMENPEELLECCFEMNPDHPHLFAAACQAAIEKDATDKDEAALLEQAERSLSLHPLFRAKVRSRIVQYYKDEADRQEDGERDETMTYLLCVDKDLFNRRERNGICETLIRRNYYTEAYEMVCRYGAEGISSKQLFRLCARMILKNLFDEDNRLLSLAYQVFQDEKNDSVILDYLCEHFNGTTEQMYQILIQGIREHVETYDLEERLVAQMLFTGRTDRLDRVFELYASRKKTSENVVRAYFTIKSAEYFLENKETADQVFDYLETAVHHSEEKDKVPDIYLLALTRYYATLPELKEEQRELCQSVVDVLIEAGMVFSYFKDLARFILIPGDILDKEMIEYHGTKDKKPYLWLRILPEEEEYHYEEMRPVYKGIYIREKVLFEGEIMEYQIREEADGKQYIAAEGSISCREVVTRAPGNRFACLNEMSLSQDVGNEAALKERMEEYIRKDAVVSSLFPLM